METSADRLKNVCIVTLSFTHGIMKLRGGSTKLNAMRRTLHLPPKIIVTHEKTFSAVVLGAIFPKPIEVRLVNEK